VRIIDVDSHFNEPADWFAKANPTLAAKLPKMTAAEQLLDIIVGDLFSSVPPGLRPNPLRLDAGAFSPEAWQPGPRIEWMNQRGIEK
jgi:hypothetical protein